MQTTAFMCIYIYIYTIYEYAPLIKICLGVLSPFFLPCAVKPYQKIPRCEPNLVSLG